MTHKTTMPEPVAWTVTVGEDFKNCIEISHCKEDVEAQYEASIEGGFESIYMLRSLITTDQAEAYAEARVREALEDAAEAVAAEFTDDSSLAELSTLRNAVGVIRALMPKGPP